MPGYIENVLARFCFPLPDKPEHSPHYWSVPSYRVKIQLSKLSDTSNPFPLGDKQRIQGIVDALLYHARALNSPLLASLSEIGIVQVDSTQHTMNTTPPLLNYCVTFLTQHFVLLPVL